MSIGAISSSTNAASAVQVAASRRAEATEPGKGRDNDGDADDRASAASVDKPSVNASNEAIGTLLHAIA